MSVYVFEEDNHYCCKAMFGVEPLYQALGVEPPCQAFINVLLTRQREGYNRF